MYVIETKTGDWFCSESKKEIEKIIGKAGSTESLEKCKNLWYQPWNYLVPARKPISFIKSDCYC